MCPSGANLRTAKVSFVKLAENEDRGRLAAAPSTTASCACVRGARDNVFMSLPIFLIYLSLVIVCLLIARIAL